MCGCVGDSNNDLPNHLIPSSPDSGFKESPSQSRKNLSEEANTEDGTDSLAESYPNAKGKKTSTERIKETSTDIKQGSPLLVRHRSTSLEAMFAEVPHDQTPCNASTDYISKVYDVSNQLNPTGSSNPGGAKFSRQTSNVSTHNSRLSSKKGSRGSMDKVNLSPDGKILSPVSIDLVEESGISKYLWSQGLENIKLEDIVSYGSNLIVLLYATLLKKGSTTSTKQRKDSFVVSRKFRYIYLRLKFV